MYSKDIMYSQRLDENYKFDSRSNISNLQKSLKLTNERAQRRPEDRELLHESSEFVRSKQVLFKDYYESKNARENIPEPQHIAVCPVEAKPVLTESQYFNSLLKDLPEQYIENVNVEVGADSKDSLDLNPAQPKLVQSKEADLSIDALDPAAKENCESTFERSRSALHERLHLELEAAKEIKQLKEEHQLELEYQQRKYEGRIAELKSELEAAELEHGDQDSDCLIQQLLQENKKNHEHIKELQGVIQRQQAESADLAQKLEQVRAESHEQFMFIESVINEDTTKVAGPVQAFHEQLGESVADLALTRWREE